MASRENLGEKVNKSKSVIENLSKDELMNVLRLMFLSRQMDEKILKLLKQGKTYFHIGCAGHEAIQIALAKAMKPKIDWAFPYYRGLAFSLALGIKPIDVFLSYFAKADDPFTGGRQMPAHYSSKILNIPTQSSPTGSQFLQAVGCALGSVKLGREEVTMVSS
ncbi:MAG: thiamine pyrophosphate-dependent enzyme, partial [Ignavibacteria bacterium]|nr:thiamine pyrophosphate-dependent enzyme [Ignavibacteria bacterium]